jgi:hypothetical protein
MDSLFRMAAIVRNEDVAEQYVLQDELARLKKFNAIKHSGAMGLETLKEIFTEPVADPIRASIEESGVQPLSTADFARLGGIQGIYETGYRVLSEEVHSTVRSLEPFVVFPTDERSGFIRLHPKLPDDSPLFPTLSTGLMALILVVEHFGLPLGQRVEALSPMFRSLFPGRPFPGSGRQEGSIAPFTT